MLNQSRILLVIRPCTFSTRVHFQTYEYLSLNVQPFLEFNLRSRLGSRGNCCRFCRDKLCIFEKAKGFYCPTLLPREKSFLRGGGGR